MKLRNSTPTLLFASVALIGLVAGCGKKSDQADKTGKSKKPAAKVNHHDVPMTDAEKKELREKVGSYAKAVAYILKCRDTIKKETTDGEPEKAHRSLDELDIVLKDLPKIAGDDKVDSKHSEDIGVHSQKLVEAFNKIHNNIDNKKAPDYESVADDIEKSIKVLSAIKTL